MGKVKLYVVSHTHWDREWYQTFQQYRYRLIRMMDKLIQGLEEDQEYSAFHLDGQTIMLEDYLEIRPENRERLEELIRAGRIIIGPWYVMPDEFLVSGESLIQNLNIGERICKRYGVSAMKNGYVTDIFGHNSQLPQILNGFGISTATLYRGIGDYEKDAFLWRAEDGSEVIVAKLDAERSYANFYFTVRYPYEGGEFDQKDARKRMQLLLERIKSAATSEHILLMDGVDHSGLEPDIPQIIQFLNKEFPDLEIIHTKLEEYFANIQTSKLEIKKGSLYQIGKRGLNNLLLKNVLSSMVHLKQKNDLCEITLTNIAEPLNAFCKMIEGCLKDYKRDDYSLSFRRTYLDRAWKYLITNHPHDSICGCSISDVHRDNEYRFRQARQIAEISANDCLELITRNIRCSGNHQEAILLYNPSQKEVKGVQIFTLPVLYHASSNRRFYDSQNRRMDVQIIEEREENVVDERLLQLVHFKHYSVLKVAAEIQIPVFGYTVIYCDHLENIQESEKAYCPEVFYAPYRLTGSQMTAHNCIDNGVFTLCLNGYGLLDLKMHADGKEYHNIHLIEDRSDKGEGWNWIPVTYDRTIWNMHCLKEFSVLADGPFCTVWELTYRMQLPDGITADGKDRMDNKHEQDIITKLTVLKNSGMIYFQTTIKNETKNHRMRVVFPTGLNTDTVYTKTPFDFTSWSIVHPDTRDYSERDTYVYPSQGVSLLCDEKHAVSLFTHGLYEIEVTENRERALAVTLFRASQDEMGTMHPEEIKMERNMTFEYALCFEKTNHTNTVLLGEQYRTGILSHAFEQNSLAGTLETSKSFFDIQAEQKIISFVCEQEGGLLIRLYDISGTEEEGILRFPTKVKSASYVNLKQEPMKEAIIEGCTVRVTCPPHKIITVSVVLEGC